MNAAIVTLPGDGIGPEVTEQAVRVLRAVGDHAGHAFAFEDKPIGGAAVDIAGDPLPPYTLDACKRADAVLLGAVGGPKWDAQPAERRPEKGLLRIRAELGLFCNLRPAVIYPSLAGRSPLRPDLVAERVDIMTVRELTGGVYFGKRAEGDDRATDETAYARDEVERVARIGFEQARKRGKRLLSVDKANVLATSRLWRRAVSALAADYPDVELEHGLVDSAAMRLVASPASIDVIVTENMFGDILSDLAAGLTGTLGLAPSASVGAGRPGLFEPVHGSAPDIAGQGKANPLAAILSAAMLLRDGLGLPKEADAVEAAVARCVENQRLTPDLGGELTTQQVGEAVIHALGR